MTATDPFLPADLGPGVSALFSTRAGGLSKGPCTSLNLAHHVGDVPSDVNRNRDILGRRLGAPPVFVDQVHGADVLVVDAPTESPRTADALVTASSDIALAIMVADCLPVLFADAQNHVVGAAHAGRRGLVSGVLPATIRAMCSLGAAPASIHAIIGPAICGRCYEVPETMRDEVAAVVAGTSSTTRWGSPGLDLPAGAVHQLTEAGLGSVRDGGWCTFSDHRFFSYRREPACGRQVGAVRLATSRPE